VSERTVRQYAKTNADSPRGVVGIYTDVRGNVIASTSDFADDKPDGTRLAEAQEWRAKDALCRAVVNAYCSQVVYNALGAYECAQIVYKLDGKMTFIRIGHES
jgi:hypothetical protein